MRILDILSPKAVKVPLESTSKRGVIDELCDLLADASPWQGVVAAVTGFDDERRDRHGQT